MDHSFEHIWKQGFLKEDALVVPKINDLYNQKSIHIIDKFKRRFKLNYAYVVVLALFHLILGILGGVPLIGVYLFALFIPLLVNSKKYQKRLSTLNKGDSSYRYLKSFQNWLQESIKSLSRIYQYFYPLYFLGLILAVLFTDFFKLFLDDTLINTVLNDPDIGWSSGWPMFWVVPLIIMLVLSFVYSKKIYQSDLESVYGGLLRKLNELITDMEELSSSS